MKWEEGGKYFIQCETHTICAVSNGREWIYELWQKRPKLRLAERRVLRGLSAEEGKAARELAHDELKRLVDEPALQNDG